MAGRDILPPKKLDLTLPKSDCIIAHSFTQFPSTIKSPSTSTKLKMITTFTNFKTIFEDRELNDMLGKMKFKPLERYMNNARHSNTLQKLPKSYKQQSMQVKEAAMINEPRHEYTKKDRELILPINSLRSEIDKMSQSMKERSDKEKEQANKVKEETTAVVRVKPLTMSKLKDVIARKIDFSAQISSHYPKYSELISEKLSKNAESSKRERILLSDLKTTAEKPHTSVILDYYHYRKQVFLSVAIRRIIRSLRIASHANSRRK